MNAETTSDLRRETEAVDFRDWEPRLVALGLPDVTTEAMRRSIVGLLGRCKANRCPVSIAMARDYLTEKGQGVVRVEALRWFVTAGRYQPKIGARLPASNVRGTDPATPPPKAATDLGTTTWEQALIRALRRNGLSWRTEQTYRQWAWSFARWLTPHPLEQVDTGAVQDFLTYLAAERGLAPASQKQALNALAFLWREGLGRTSGDFSDFVRARPRSRLPVVLTPEECARVLAQLEGTVHLIVALLYGTGLRVLEGLRLRVQEIDRERGRITVRAGKGGKDRMVMLPESLQSALTRHIGDLRSLHARDRAAGVAGVWLPEGLARKYPNAGTEFGESRAAPISRVFVRARKHWRGALRSGGSAAVAVVVPLP